MDIVVLGRFPLGGQILVHLFHIFRCGVVRAGEDPGHEGSGNGCIVRIGYRTGDGEVQFRSESARIAEKQQCLFFVRFRLS